jgi:hypothetical protein
MAKMLDYKAKRAADIVGSTTDAQLFQAADGSGNVVVVVPAKAKVFKVRASGIATGGTTVNFNPTIYWGNATTTALGAHAASAYNSASGAWYLELLVHFDATNSKLHGHKSGFVGTTPTVLAPTILADVTSISSVDLTKLAVGGTFSAANAGNLAKLDSFSIEVVETAK